MAQRDVSCVTVACLTQSSTWRWLSVVQAQRRGVLGSAAYGGWRTVYWGNKKNEKHGRVRPGQYWPPGACFGIARISALAGTLSLRG